LDYRGRNVPLPPSKGNMGARQPPSSPIVHVVEDDRASREATARFLRAAGHQVRTYASAAEFLETAPVNGPGCVILDLQLPGLSGLDLQRKLSDREDPLPVVFLSGRSEVPQSVQAMKQGAVDFLTKTAHGSEVLAAVSAALSRDASDRDERGRLCALRNRHNRLSPREREVLAHLISGQLNKQVGFDLGISEQTTKIHRHRILEKMQAHSIADLVRMASDLGIIPVGAVR
jgi:FixJ family two-component response regulator